MSERHAPHGIIPPFVHRSIEEHGTESQQARARAALVTDHIVRAERSAVAQLAVVPPSAPAAPEHRTVFDAHHLEQLPGSEVRDEGAPATSDGDADRAYDGFGATWRLYSEVFGRDSYDGAGATLIGSVHYGEKYDNAFWDGTQMVFGDGDGTIFGSFTGAVDIMGHELTHAVTEKESGLAYHDQPGALNESLSDVFGSLVKQYVASPQPTAEEADWLIGAGIWAPGIHGEALRSMKAPGTAYDDPTIGKDPQPADMADYDHTTDDHGGVHTNSGIPNKAFYLFAVALGGHAWERAGQVWYAAATDPSMTPETDFATFADLTVSHARAAYDTSVADACVQAWAGVGVTVTSPLAATV